MINISLAPQTWKLLMRAGFFKYTNWARATELPLFASVPRIAIKEKIPLIFWGENPSLQLGDLAAAGKTGYDGNNLKNMNTLDGGDLSWMLELGIKESELIQFKYPTHDEFIEADIQIIYLGWFWNDWSLASNGIYSSLNGLDIRDDGVENTGDFTNVTALDEDWVTLNQMIKYYKYGFGRVTDYVNEQIRFNKINREVGIKLLEEYDGNCGTEYIDSFCSYIDITIEQFWKQVHSAVNKELFSIEEGNTPAGQIRPKFKVGEGI